MAAKPIGNLKSASALEMWNGRAMQRLRKNIKDNKIDPICVGGSCRYVMKDEIERRAIEASKKELEENKAAFIAEMAPFDEFK